MMRRGSSLSRSQPVIGFSQQPSGGYGNWAFQVNILYQIARLSGVPAAFPRYRERGFPAPRTKASALLDGSARLLSKSSIESSSPQDVALEVAESVASGRSVCLEVGILGEPFNQYSAVDPIRLFSKPRELFAMASRAIKPRSGMHSSTAPIVVGLHYRGTDFSAWDPTAVMPLDYYLSAMEEVQVGNPNRELSFYGVTDEPESFVVRELSKLGARFPRGRASASRDFMILNRADVVIAPPSTFSFWSSILGGKTIYFPRIWVEKKSQSSNFWKDAGLNSVKYIDIRLA